jgi:negative regulator of flagellin synthesis FlgM
MSDIAPIGRPSPAGPSGGGRITPNVPASAPPTRGADSVELSREAMAAQWVSRLSELPQIRQDVVTRVKAEIAQGTYDTDDKLDAAISNMAQDLTEA